jgi:hypothetical protein
LKLKLVHIKSCGVQSRQALGAFQCVYNLLIPYIKLKKVGQQLRAPTDDNMLAIPAIAIDLSWRKQGWPHASMASID